MSPLRIATCSLALLLLPLALVTVIRQGLAPIEIDLHITAADLDPQLHQRGYGFDRRPLPPSLLAPDGLSLN